MDAVRTISTVATQLTAQEKKGMFVAIATPISAALFALIGYAHAKVESNSQNFYIKRENKNIRLFREEKSLCATFIQLASEQTKESSNDPNQSLQRLVQEIIQKELNASLDRGGGYLRDFYTPIKNHIIKLAFVGAILPAAILALYEKGADTLATETLQVISNLGAKALRNRGTSICLIVLLIAAKHFHNNTEENGNTYLDELSETGKHFLRYIPGFGKRASGASSYEYGYDSSEQQSRTGWFSWLFNRNSDKYSEE